MKANKMIAITLCGLILGLIIAVLTKNKKEIDENARMSLQVNTIIPVNVTKPQYQELSSDRQVNGKIVAAHSVTITSKTNGIVLKKYKKAGDHVTAGTAIVKAEDHLVRENLRIAEANYAKAKKDAQRYETLWKAGAVTKTEAESVQQALENAEGTRFDQIDKLKNTTVTAPFTGVLEKIHAEEGTLLSPGTPVADIIDPKQLKMEVAVTEKEVVRLAKGQQVKITSDVFEGTVFEGTIDAIGSQGNDNLCYMVEIRLNDKQATKLKPGMSAVAHFQSDNKRKELTIERLAIAGGLKNPYVFVVKDGKAYRKNIVTGNVVSNRVEVVEGISENDLIVLNGHSQLADGAQVSVKL
jgi:RND family efflux transporter MFP subunit